MQSKKKSQESELNFKEAFLAWTVFALLTIYSLGGLFGVIEGLFGSKYRPSKPNSRISKIVFTYRLGYYAGFWLTEEEKEEQ